MSLPETACSVVARAHDDPLIATAPPTRRWLLLDVPRAWPEKILRSPEVAGAVPALGDIVDRRQGRVLFVRRPGGAVGARLHPDDHGPIRGFLVVDAPTRTQTRGAWRPAAAGRPAADLTAALAAFDADGPLAEPAAEVLLVCSHGTHDQCCAVRGRPVAAVLAERYEHVLECSHVGGDRFGGNLLALPTGTYLGRLDADSAPAVVAAHLAGRDDPAHLRGVTTQDQRVQAAVTATLAAYGAAAAYRLHGEIVGHPAPDRWHVSVSGHPAAAQVRVEVRRIVLSPAPRACRAEIDKVAVTYETALLDS